MVNQLSREDVVRRVEPKVMEVLVCMARRPGRTVTKDQFMEEVWAGTIVTDDVLARCISELRKALGDSAQRPEYVETIRKRGYRLIAPVESVEREPVRAFSSGEGAASEEGGAEIIRDDTAKGTAKPVAGLRAAVRRRRLRRRLRVAVLAGVAVLIVGTVAVQQYIVARTQPLATVPVTSYPGEETDPALSPDGRSIAFTWDAGDGINFDLYVQPAVDEAPLQLTRTDADEFSPAWSQDGAQLAFARCSGGGCSIFVVPAFGGRERRIADLRPLHVRDLVWSPDGRTLALSARREPRGAFGLILLPLGTREPLRLTDSPASPPGDLDPAWSPDGQYLAFVRTTVDGRQDVCLVPREGGEVQRLAREQQGVTGLDWTADGRSVVYAANRQGASGLWRVRASGGPPVWVAVGDGGEVYQPSVARNGRGITFAQRRHETNISEIVRAGGRAGTPQRLIESTRWDSHPAVSPDGERIAFVSNRSGNLEIWTADPDGNDLQRRTSFGGPRVSTPRWSPDGTHIVFTARVNGHADLYIVEPGSPPRRFTDHSGDEVAPSWSRDGKFIYFASRRNGDWQIWRQGMDENLEPVGDLVPVTRYGGIAAEETPDGRYLIVVRPERRNLWRIPLDEELAEQRSVAIAPLNPSDWANWTIRQEGIYLVHRRAEEGAADILLVDPDTRVPELVARLDALPEHPSLAVFPGGRRLLVTQVERSDSDIVLVQDFH
ncbi:MAG: hypothetical protein HKN04_07935 [Rhodothermaceae bacterium]|nr:hypothetical protein [Rhodothermaceae bacterium]